MRTTELSSLVTKDILRQSIKAREGGVEQQQQLQQQQQHQKTDTATTTVA